jgi:hypothetical protein
MGGRKLQLNSKDRISNTKKVTISLTSEQQDKVYSLQPPNQYTTTMHNIIITLPKELLQKAAIKAAEQQVSRKKFIETLIINQLTK